MIHESIKYIATQYPVTFELCSDEAGGGFYAYSASWSGLLADGDTIEDAYEDWLEVLVDTIKFRFERNMPLPEVMSIERLWSMEARK